MIFTDALFADGMKRTVDGYLTASVRAARTGIQIYSGAEVGKPEMAQVRVYRPEAEVFKKDAMASFTTIPVTVNHPPAAVTADNWREYAVGSTGEDIARDGDFIRVPIIVKDAAAIRQIESGKRQLSMGYACDLDWTAGTTADGLTYDAKQTNLIGNHLAIVDAARGGSFLTIDGDTAVAKFMMVDGLQVEVTDAAELAINKLLGTIKTVTDAATASAAKFTADLSTSAAKIATLDAEIATLKSAQLTGDKLDAAVAERAQLLADAKTIGGANIDLKGTNDDIKKRAVLVKLGDTYKDRDKAFFDAAFELQVAGLGNRDQVRDAIRGGTHVADGAKQVSDAHAAMVRSLTHPGEKAA